MPASIEARARGPQARDAVAAIAIVTALVVAGMAAHVGAGADDEHCARVFDRWVELRHRQADPKLSAYELEGRVSAARALAERSGALERCRRGAPREALACAERAGTVDELERCLP